MLRKTLTFFKVFAMILTLMCASVDVARAQSITLTDATIQKAVSMQRRGRYRAPCDRKQRAKAGAVIGFVAGMVIVNRIAADYDSSAGFKATLAAGGYGAAMGAWLGVATCR
jgi:Zn-dependent protease